jgi:hypothetical protein
MIAGWRRPAFFAALLGLSATVAGADLQTRSKSRSSSCRARTIRAFLDQYLKAAPAAAAPAGK